MASEVTICQKCGDKGWPVALIYCHKCQVAAEHRYCLDILPATFTEYVTWFCEDCEPKVSKASPEKAIPAPSRKSDRLAKSTKLFLARKRVKRSIEARTSLKRKNISRSVTRTKVQKHDNSHVQPSEARGSRNHKKDQKLEKQRRLILKDKANNDEKAESNRLSKDQNLEEVESSKVCIDQNIGDAKSSKISQSQKLEASEFSKMGRNQKLDVSKSCKISNDRKLEEVKSIKINTNQKLEEPESNKTSVDLKLEKQHRPILEASEFSKMGRNQKLDESKSCKISNDRKLEEVESIKINANQKLEGPESNKTSVDLKLEKQHRPILEDMGTTDQDGESNKINTNDYSSNTSEQNTINPAQPFNVPVWRGKFSIRDMKFSSMDGLAAHLSTKACFKVGEEARLLPKLLFSDMLSREDVWPKSFGSSGPRDDHIALYFFPETEIDERVFDSIVEYMIEKDLAMRSVVVNAELLVFTSTQLPGAYWRFQRKHYLWGVFREKQPPFPREEEGHFTVHSSSNKSNVTVVSIAEERGIKQILPLDSRSPISPLSNGSAGDDEHF